MITRLWYSVQDDNTPLLMESEELCKLDQEFLIGKNGHGCHIICSEDCCIDAMEMETVDGEIMKVKKQLAEIYMDTFEDKAIEALIAKLTALKVLK